MKKLYIFFFSAFFFSINICAYSQGKIYLTSGAETIFSVGQLDYTQAFINENPGVDIVKQPLRFTSFFHIGEFVHLNLTNNIGLFSGFGLRNIGMISDEVLPDEVGSDNYVNTKIIRRAYTAGIPLAVKLGSFKDHFFVYAGGEYEYAFHMKEKYWDDHNRKGDKIKNTIWMPEQITTVLPSAFIGVQLPKGLNVKLKYYFEDFLNHEYITNKTGLTGVVSDLTKYRSSKVVYIAISWQIKNAYKNKFKPGGEVATLL
ncbi:MAG: hypothetical protein JXA77_14110 [Bacteroidales bacterium]|nr:hypothetical protein [Bacteroidales bacterium]MBN2819238.1 hypothetical protein [Bacteroidales bacterium]